MEPPDTSDRSEGSAERSGPRFVRWTEPGAHAFTLVVPEGWRVEGGVIHLGAEMRPWYRVRSPGGGAELRVVDPRVPTSFVEPSWGMMPIPGAVIRPFTPPEVFADEYARGFARESGASRFEPLRVRPTQEIVAEETRPEKRQRIEWMLQQGASMAGVEFALPDQGRRGIVDVTCLRMPTVMGSTWTPFVTALLGPADAWPAVKESLVAIARTFAFTAGFEQMQAMQRQVSHQMAMDNIATGSAILRMQHQSGMEAIQAAAQRAQISADANASVAASQMAGWRAQQASSDEVHRRAVNGVREVVDVVDPTTGVVYTGAPAGFHSYWTDGVSHRVVASEGSENPDASRYARAVNLDDVPLKKR